MREEALLESQHRSWPRRHATVIGIQLLIGFALVMAVVIGLWNAARPLPTSGIEGTPEEIAGLRRTEVMTGSQAMAELQALHGKDVGVVGGWIAHYGEEATVWMGEAQDEVKAVQLLEAMTRRIQADNRYFTELKQLQVDGRPVFTVVGQGQRHYYYRQGRQVIWLAAPSGQEDRFLRAALLAVK